MEKDNTVITLQCQHCGGAWSGVAYGIKVFADAHIAKHCQGPVIQVPSGE